MSPAETGGVLVNGAPQPLPADGRLVTVLSAMGISATTAGVAVAVNEAIVPRARWEAAQLRPGDRIEIVRAVQGG